MIAVRTHRNSWVALPAFAALLTLLFQYRILSLLKRLGFAVSPVGTKLPLEMDFQTAPQWLLPFYYTVDYLNVVWFATILGLLMAGALVSLTPGLVRGALAGNGWRQLLGGLLLGLPNMFCTCCAVSTANGLRKAGAGLLSSLAFFVAAPSLNIVVILLAFQLLPLKLAIARTLLGTVAALGVTYAVFKLNPGLQAGALQSSQKAAVEESAIAALGSWLHNTWEITKTVIPLLVLGILVISLFKTAFPFDTIARYLGDGLWPTLLASAVGTILMVPTFTEVLWVQEFTKQGMGMGPAVALLITLPAVSLPSLWVLGKVFQSYRLAASLGIGTLLLGVIGGVAFTLI